MPRHGPLQRGGGSGQLDWEGGNRRTGRPGTQRPPAALFQAGTDHGAGRARAPFSRFQAARRDVSPAPGRAAEGLPGVVVSWRPARLTDVPHGQKPDRATDRLLRSTKRTWHLKRKKRESARQHSTTAPFILKGKSHAEARLTLKARAGKTL